MSVGLVVFSLYSFSLLIFSIQNEKYFSMQWAAWTE
jgi:hypothetical protein